jgi:hypothetical protein
VHPRAAGKRSAPLSMQQALSRRCSQRSQHARPAGESRTAHPAWRPVRPAAILRGEQPANDSGGGGVVIDLERYAQLAQVAR